MTLQFLPDRAAFMAFLDLRLRTVGLGLGDLDAVLPPALDQMARSLALSSNPYARDAQGTPTLRLAQYSQMTLLLYRLARAAHLAGAGELADRLYFLNVSQGGCDLYHAVDLPLRTHCDHALGTVIGRGQFAANAVLVFADGCCVGNNRGAYPQVRGALIMLGHSAVLGRTAIHGTVVLGRGAQLIDSGEVRDCLVVGSGPQQRLLPLDRAQAQELCPFELG